MFCNKCGSRIPEGANYCGKCGININNLHCSGEIKNSNSTTYGITKRKDKDSQITLIKSIFVVVCIITIIISNGELIDFNGELYRSFTLKEFVGYVKIVSTIIEDIDVQFLTLGLWFIYIGDVLFIIAAIIVFFNANTSQVLTVTGVILNFISIIFFVTGCINMVDGAQLGNVLSMFSGLFWFYLVFNIILVILASVVYAQS